MLAISALQQVPLFSILPRMKYSRFEDLPVWNAARDLAVRIMLLADDPAFRGRGDLGNQLQRAALSVSNNVAEGFEVGTTAQLIAYLYIAKGSAGEVRSMLRLMSDTRLPYFRHVQHDLNALIELAGSVSRQLSGFAGSLQNSDIAGPRHLTDDIRNAAGRKARAASFLQSIEHLKAGGVRDPE